MDTIYNPVLDMQSGENVAGLSDEKAYEQFLFDMKDESPMSMKEKYHFVGILRQQGQKLNRLMEFPVIETQY